MSTTSLAAPGPDDGDQGADHHQADQAKASPGRGKGPGTASADTSAGTASADTSAGTASADTSAGTSVPPTPDQFVSAGQQPRTRGRSRGDNPPPATAEVRWKADSTEPVRHGVLVSLGLFQRATARELWHLVLPGQRNDKATRDALVDLEAAGRVREELRLPDNRKLWTLTAAGRREAARLLPAGTKLSKLRTERDGRAAAYSEHALDVVATAGHLARAGLGYLEAFSTEVEHPIPHRRSLFTDLVLRDPGAEVPVLLVEVDRENEGVGALVEKLTLYRAWCELAAKGTAKPEFEASLRCRGARTHGLRLWPTVYPPTGREGLPSVALVLEAGRKRDRPGAEQLTPQQKAEKAKRDHERLLRRHGADAPVWHRFGRCGWHTLTEALDNPDGDELLAVERAEADRARRAREAAERERRRPACRSCSAKFSDGRREEKERGWNDDGLCAGCRQADADRKAREAAGRERAAAEAAAAEAKRTSFWWRRS
ncbi:MULTISPECIES: replication-relaxation family protein [Streptomycetaceae]|uniref:replication-relaxation family protein n=1 Tax=Streptomycetaceae TaxID=2062 RepID=UPI00093DEDC9|nr:replication-relaxation family protein [Streptomyces sp. CB02056]